MRKIIVTGGAGFIGSHTVVELHSAGYTPIIIDNFSNSDPMVIDRLESITGTKIKLYNIDCNNKEAFSRVFLEDKSIFGVIHFAAHKAVGESVNIPLAYYRNNIDSLLTVIELMVQFKVPNLVFSSSCTVYGQPGTLPVTEKTSMKYAESPYGNTKKICESIIEDVVTARESLKAVTLRYFNPIGAHSSGLIGELPLGTPNNLVPFITQTAAGIRNHLTVFGDGYNTPDGSCIRDFIHVMDLAKAHVKALDWLHTCKSERINEVFNIGTGSGYSVLEVIKTFETVVNLKLNYVIGKRRSGDIEQIYANVDKAENVLNWKAVLTLEDAMRDAWKWQLALEKNC